MMMKRKSLWIVMMFVFTLITSGYQSPVFAAIQGSQGTISVFGGDDATPLLSETPIQYRENETAVEALVNVLGENNIEFTDTTSGKMVTSINGVKAEGTNFWSFYINGVAAQVGAGTYIVQDGDKLSFRLKDWTKPSQNTVSINVMDGEKNIVKELKDIEIIGHPTAFQLLQVALGSDLIGFSESKYGKMITSINGIEAKGTNYWAFYVNDKAAEVGADTFQLQPSNQISFRYESWGSVPDESNNVPTPPAGGTFSEPALKGALDSASQYVVKNQIGEWEAIALKQAGKNIPASYLENVRQLVKDKKGKFRSITDPERYTLGVLAAGGDPTNIDGYNLVEAIYNGDVTKQGLNGVAYALIALDSANFKVPDTALWTRDKLIQQLLNKQNQDGGWTWDVTSTTSDIDTTGMVLAALAPYKNQVGVKEKVDSALQYITTQFNHSKIDNSSTAAQIIIALSALGIDANGSQFKKDNTSLLQFFLTFQNTDGGFDYMGGDESDAFSTAFGIQALASYQLFTQGKGSLFTIPLDVQKPALEKPKTEQPGLPTKEKDYLLPDTATDTFNLLALGLLVMFIGSLILLQRKRRKV